MKYVCCHAHFYQPERADPWSRQVVGDTNWNECITVECYRPLYEAGLLGKMSWNIFPSLFNWLAEHHPDIARGFQEADTEALRQTSYGCAVASPYVHMIAPLATEDEWSWSVSRGIDHFKRVFRRNPRAMWLPETAVSWETMNEASRQGIEYFILMNHQAFSVRGNDEKGKMILSEEQRITTDRVYECWMEDDRKTKVVFVNNKIYNDMSAMAYLMYPKGFSDSLLAKWKVVEDPGLLLIATDGEYYGHHFGHGVTSIDKGLRNLSYHGASVVSLEKAIAAMPVAGEIEVRDNTSWTCKHGIDRWISECGCRNDGRHRDQKWKGPLHELVKRLTKLAHDTWLAQIKDRGIHQKIAQDVDTAFLEGDETVRKALVTWMAPGASGEAQRAVYDLMELRLCAFLLKNSCIFYFETLDRDEMRQSMRYAAKVAWIMESLGVEVFSWFLSDLKKITCEGFTAQQIFVSSVQDVPEVWCKERGLPSPEGLKNLVFGSK